VTREERNVLAFIAAGILLGSVPWPEPEPDPPESAPGEAAAVVEMDLFPIDLNTAGPELLEELPGIGAAKAKAIVDLRTERGRFRSVEELEDVHGIGARTVERLRDLVSVSAPPDSSRDRERHTLVQPPRNAAPGEPDSLQGAAGAGPEAAEVFRGAAGREPREAGVHVGR
jgi:competence protein ComEA